MKAKELIKELDKAIKIYGDLEVIYPAEDIYSDPVEEIQVGYMTKDGEFELEEFASKGKKMTHINLA